MIQRIEERLGNCAARGLSIDAAGQSFLQPLAEYGRGPVDAERCCDREEIRHILLGSPGAVRQVIHQLHVLNYAESVLWSPIVAVGERIIITPEQGKAMSLLRR